MSRSEPADGAADADRMYRALAEYASDLITVLSPHGEIRYASPSVERILGYEPEEIIGRNAFEFVHPDDRELVRESLAAGLEDPGVVRVVEYRCRHADGSWLPLESSGRRPPAEAELDGVLVHTREVTRGKSRERHRREDHRMEVVSRLVSGIAHDFNNLLTVITGNADVLLQDVDETDPRHDEVAEIRAAAGRAAILTRNLLAFAGQESLRLRTVDLAAGLEQMRPEIEERLGDAATLDMRLEPGAARVRVDPELAREVALEIVSNAREAMPDGGTLRIELTKESVGPQSDAAARGVEPGDWVVVSYTDTGRGMTDEVRERAFHPFFSTKAGRSGLGLSAVYGLVKQSGGEVSIESSPGEGATIRTYMPDADASDG